MTIDTSRLTDEQRRNLRRWSRFPSTLWVSQAKFAAHLERYLAEADRREQEQQAQALVDEQRAYFATLSRVTGYDGPDYRVRFSGQQSWVRATKHMYEQAERDNLPCSIGVPEVAELVAA